MLEPFTIPLDDPQATLEAVGGKGASLARLARAGLPVPGGFHITTAAYRQFIAVNDLRKGVMAALKIVDAAKPETLEAAAQPFVVRGKLLEQSWT